MNESTYLLLAGAACFWGLSALALAIKVHWQQLFVAPLSGSMQKCLRALGVIALAISAYFAGQADHPSMAVLVWVMLLPLMTVVIALLLNRCPAVFRLIFPFIGAIQGLITRA